MARPKYKLQKGKSRTPEEHRKILSEIDVRQCERSRKGVLKSKKRIKNTFGVSSTAYKNERKPELQRPRIYELSRYTNYSAYEED